MSPFRVFAKTEVGRSRGPERMNLWFSGSGFAASFRANFSSAVLTASEGPPRPPQGRNPTFRHQVTLTGSRNGGVEKLASAATMSRSCSSAFAAALESMTSSAGPASPISFFAVSWTR